MFAEFTEVESGKKAARPQFNEALRLCRIFSAVLVIAKLDRLARNVALISQLMESGVEFVAADFPQANRLTIHILAAIAEYEVKLISERVKAAIVASKARGVVWGGNRNSPTAHLDDARLVGNEGRRRRAIARAIDLEPLIMEMRQGGKSLKGIAAELNRLGIRQRAAGSIGLQVLFAGPCDGQRTCFPTGKNGTSSRSDLNDRHADGRIPLHADAALMPLLAIARRVSDARRPSPAVADLEGKANPYGFERRPNCFLVGRRYFPTLLERGITQGVTAAASC